MSRAEEGSAERIREVEGDEGYVKMHMTEQAGSVWL